MVFVVFLLEFEAVPTVWYFFVFLLEFGAVPTVCYFVFLLKFGAVPTVWYLLFFYWSLELYRQRGICCYSIGVWSCSYSVVFFVFY